jgi:hypothetical protein
MKDTCVEGNHVINYVLRRGYIFITLKGSVNDYTSQMEGKGSRGSGVLKAVSSTSIPPWGLALFHLH